MYVNIFYATNQLDSMEHTVKLITHYTITYCLIGSMCVDLVYQVILSISFFYTVITPKQQQFIIYGYILLTLGNRIYSKQPVYSSNKNNRVKNKHYSNSC